MSVNMFANTVASL